MRVGIPTGLAPHASQPVARTRCSGRAALHSLAGPPPPSSAAGPPRIATPRRPPSDTLAPCRHAVAAQHFLSDFFSASSLTVGTRPVPPLPQAVRFVLSIASDRIGSERHFQSFPRRATAWRGGAGGAGGTGMGCRDMADGWAAVPLCNYNLGEERSTYSEMDT